MDLGVPPGSRPCNAHTSRVSVSPLSDQGDTSTVISLLVRLLAPQPELLLGPKPIFLRSSNRRPAFQPILVRQARDLFSFWAVARSGLHLRRFNNNLLRLIPG